MFLGPLEWRYLFGSKDKVFNHQKLVFKSGVRFLFLFVLTDAILLNLNLQKRTSSDIKLPSQKLFVQQKWCLYPKFMRVYYILDIKVILCSVNKLSLPLKHFQTKELPKGKYPGAWGFPAFLKMFRNL